jgi:methyl-accepting chemotaxis protein
MFDYVAYAGLVAVTAAATIAALFLLYRRGVAVKLGILFVGMTAAASIAGFVFGKAGISIGTIALAAVIVLPAYGLVALALRFLVGPLRAVVEVFRNLAVGDVGDEVALTGWDELAELQRAFNEVRAYLSDLAAASAKIGAGNFSAEVKPASDRDALGSALAATIASLRASVGQVAGSADSLGREYGRVTEASGIASEAVQQITTRLLEVSEKTASQMEALHRTSGVIEGMLGSMGQVSQGAEGQARSVAEAATATASIVVEITGVADRASVGARSASDAVLAARNGATTIEANLTRMQSIERSTLKVQEKVDLMGERSGQIGSILETIESIASQTNLLALNAAIEAARAGEHGRGFAVVADEVRQLAEKSAGATREIADLIRGIQETVRETVRAIADQAQEVQAGAVHSSSAAAALAEIVRTVDAIQVEMHEISSGTERISDAARTLTDTMDAVSLVARDNSAAAKEIEEHSAEVTRSFRAFATLAEESQSAIDGVNDAAQRVSEQESGVARSIGQMSDLAVDLQQQVMRFTTAQVTGKVSRGNALLGRLDFVKDKYGLRALDRVLAAVDPEHARILRGRVDPEGSYPPELLGALTSAIRKELAGGSDDILREMTRYRARFDIAPGAPLARHFKAGDPGHIVHRMDLCLRHNWGEGVTVQTTDVGPGHVHQEVDMGRKQPRERCTYNHVGWMEGVIDASGGIPHIRKTACMHDGAPRCVYEIEWEMADKSSALRDRRAA